MIEGKLKSGFEYKIEDHALDMMMKILAATIYPDTIIV